MGTVNVKLLTASALSTFLLVASVNQPAQAEVLTYTQSTNSSNEMALGYPVPQPVDSLTAIHGFRSYDSLKAHHEALALLHEEMRGTHVGTTHNGRTITAYQFGDLDSETGEGVLEPAFLINGTIHAREWQSPEVVTELMERLLEEKDSQGMVQYLLDNTNIIILPVLNIDGFLQTQRFPNNVTQTPSYLLDSSDNPNDPVVKFAQPRDGRMRRKNMPNVDEVLSTEADRLRGIDLNRNSEHFFGVQADNSVPNSLIYGGSFAFSEPETQALQQAATLGPANNLRFYQDTHSFSRVLYVNQPSNSRLNTIATGLATKFQNTTKALGADYFPVIDEVGQGIPTTADYFAYEYHIPTWTLEIEPPQGFQGVADGGAFYGGTGASHSGFVMPDSAIARTRDQLAPAQLLMFYHQAGPAHVQSVRLADENNQIVYAADWTLNANGSARTLNVSVDEAVNAGQTYKLWANFNKPMRHRTGSGVVSQFTGQSVTLAPGALLTGDTGYEAVNHNFASSTNAWQNQPGGELSGFKTYQDDAILMDITIPTSIQTPNSTGTVNLNVGFSLSDLSGLALDANPATVTSWQNGHWAGYENTQGQQGDTGGTDDSYTLKVNNSSLTLNTNPRSSGGSGGGAVSWNLLLLLGLAALIRRRNRVTTQ